MSSRPCLLKFRDSDPFGAGVQSVILDHQGLRHNWLSSLHQAQSFTQGNRLENLTWRKWAMQIKAERRLSTQHSPVSALAASSQSQMFNLPPQPHAFASSSGQIPLAGQAQAGGSHSGLDWPALSAPIPVHAANSTASTSGVILATPSWATLFHDQGSAAALFPPASAPSFDAPLPATSSATSPAFPFLPPHNPQAGASQAHLNQQPAGTQNQFALPSQAHSLADPNHDPAALAEAASGGAAFYSSYGLYQPIIAPYPRFLTPSPEPSQRGDFDLDLNGFESLTNTHSPDRPTSPRRDITYDTLWNGYSAQPSTESTPHDPFAGMNLSQSAGPSSPSAFEGSSFGFAGPSGVAGQRFELPPQGGMHAFENHNRQIQMDVDGGQGGPASWPPVQDEDAKGKKRSIDGEDEGSPVAGGAEGSAGAPKTKKPRAPRAKGSATPSGGSTVPLGSAPGTPTLGATAGGGGGGKKNRNPHATQLPGNGTRKLVKPEAADDHSGPICSHCQAISTPLWRRGPDDELLCNACGLYLKLHNKPRPKGFGKNAPTNRGGAAAQAAASSTPPKCANCEATSTPMWRKDVDGNLCCNACSLYFKLHQVVRPAALANKKRAAAAAAAAAAAESAQSTPGTTDELDSAGGQVANGGASVPSMAIPSLDLGSAEQQQQQWAQQLQQPAPPRGFPASQVFAPLISLATPSNAAAVITNAQWTPSVAVPGEQSPGESEVSVKTEGP